MTTSSEILKLNCERCRREVVPIQKMGGRVCPYCRIILDPVIIAEVILTDKGLQICATEGKSKKPPQ